MGNELVVSTGDGRDGAPLDNFGGRHTPGNAGLDRGVTAAGDAGRPTFTAEELGLIDPLRDLDAEDIATWRKQIADGIMTPADLARHQGLSAVQIEALQAPPAKLQKAVETELAEIRALRKTDAKKYYSDAVQKRELALLRRARAAGKAEAPPASSESAAALERGDGSDIDPDLRAEWENQGGVAYHLDLAQRAVEAMVEGMDEGERTGFMAGFDALPAGARTQVFRWLGIDGGGSVRAASQAQLDTFAANGEACAAVMKGWSAKAAHKYAAAEARLDGMLNAMSESDAAAAEGWFRALSGDHKAAVIKALAG